MDKKVRKTYDNIASKLEDWFNIIKELAAATAKKIEVAAKAAKDFTIDKKDKALIWGIQKGVKGLSDKYTEDQVVALVRKCYNESLIPDIRGNYRINEAYFHKAGTTSRRLYENKKIRRNRLR
jgi:DNA topoisomerase VI subunit A